MISFSSFHSKKISNQIWRPAPHLTWKIEENETVVLDPQEAKAYHFNGTGAFIWNALTQKNSLHEITQQLCEKFEVRQKNALQDVTSFLKHLQAQDLIVKDAEAS